MTYTTEFQSGGDTPRLLGVNTYQWSHPYDGIAGNSLIRGAIRMIDNYKGKNSLDSHSINSFGESNFINQLMTLPQGDYIYRNGTFISQ